MIKPDKYTDIKYSTIGIAAVIIKKIGKKYIKIDKLISDIIEELGEDAKFNFTNSINFLYMTGKIDYNIQRDAIKIGDGKLENK